MTLKEKKEGKKTCGKGNGREEKASQDERKPRRYLTKGATG